MLISYGLFNKEINNLKIAKNLFILSIKKYPSKINTYILLAEIFRKENNVNDALKTLQVAKNIEDQNPEIDYNLAISYKIINLYPSYKVKKFFLKIVNKTFIGSN